MQQLKERLEKDLIEVLLLAGVCVHMMKYNIIP